MSPIPKVEVEVGDEVKAGDVLFYDKKRPEIKYVSPVSGEIVAINRGEKRSIEEIVVLADKTQTYTTFEIPDIQKADRQDIVNVMLTSGMWTKLNQRPFDVVPDINAVPRDIFISTFDTAPLSPDTCAVIDGRMADFQKGVDVLARLTDGTVHIGLNAADNGRQGLPFVDTENCRIHWFDVPHPRGNVGVQILHINPILPGQQVWTLTLQDVLSLGYFFNNGIVDGKRIVAIVGNEVNTPTLVRTYQGAAVTDLLQENVRSENVRIISGDVLSGKQINNDGFVAIKDDQITVIKEGDQYEMFGWLLPISPRPSVSGTFPNFLYPNHKFEVDTNTHGEKRAFVVSGLYESVLPMDIYPMHLMKAIMAGDFEKMEGLGINELSEEDIALCEFVCVSKTPLQSILREGLDTVKAQM